RFCLPLYHRHHRRRNFMVSASCTGSSRKRRSMAAMLPFFLGSTRAVADMFSEQLRFVAQICNLLYRRFVIGRASDSPSALALADAPQNPILRYSRLQICATPDTCPRRSAERARRPLLAKDSDASSLCHEGAEQSTRGAPRLQTRHVSARRSRAFVTMEL